MRRRQAPAVARMRLASGLRLPLTRPPPRCVPLGMELLKAGMMGAFPDTATIDALKAKLA